MPIMQKFPVAIWDVVRKNCASYWKVSCPTCVHCGPCSATLLSFRQKATVQAQAEALCGLVPLVGNRAAVAEHHKAIQPLFLVQLVEAEQGPQGFAGPGSGMDQYISGVPIGGLLAQARP